jgi:hypothetical protein
MEDLHNKQNVTMEFNCESCYIRKFIEENISRSRNSVKYFNIFSSRYRIEHLKKRHNYRILHDSIGNHLLIHLDGILSMHKITLLAMCAILTASSIAVAIFGTTVIPSVIAQEDNATMTMNETASGGNMTDANMTGTNMANASGNISGCGNDCF